MRGLSRLLPALAIPLLLARPAAGEEDWRSLEKEVRRAFRALDVPAPDRLAKEVRPRLPPGIVIEAGPFDALVARLLAPLEEDLRAREEVLERLSASPFARTGRLVTGVLDVLVGEAEELAEHVDEVEELYARVYDRGWMEASERQREDRKLAAVLIPYYRSLLFWNEGLRARAAAALSAFGEGEGREWLTEAATGAKETAVRLAAVEALARVGGAQAEAALRRALASDAVSAVRARALGALLAWPVGRVRDAIRDALADPAWEVRALAVEACARGMLVEAAEALVEALAREEGRLRTDIDDALHALVGVRMYGDVGRWRRWLEENRETLASRALDLEAEGAYERVLGRPETWADAEAAGPDEERRGGTASFYGIVTESRRILFVIDISRSMADEAAEVPAATTGDRGPYARPRGRTKMAIAKWQLHRAIEDLPEDAVFGILVYSESYAAWPGSPARASRRAKAKAHDFVDGLAPNGTTNIADSLDEAFDLAGAGPLGLPRRASEQVADTLFLLSDGDPNRGRLSSLAALLEGVVGRARRHRLVIHAVGIGEAAGSVFLQDLARRTGGRYVGFR